MSKTVLLGFIVYIISTSLTHATLKCEFETVLQEQLLDNYNVNVVPKDDFNALEVNVSFIIINIRKFHEIEEVLSTSATFTFRWIDHRLAWNISERGNVTKTTFKQKQIWLPDLNIANSATEFTQLGNTDMNIQVSSSGLVVWEPVSIIESTCYMDSKFFPFDHQECSITLLSWAHTSDIVTLNPKRFDLSYALLNEIWDVKVASPPIMTTINRRIAVRYVLYLKRRTGYYTIPLLLPLFSMSILNCFSVLVPKSSGETITYSITVFLSYMVLMTFTTDVLPKTSTDQPVIVSFIGVMLCLALVASIYNILAVFLFTRSSKNTIKTSQCPSAIGLDHKENSGCRLLFRRILRNHDLWMFALVCVITIITSLWAVLSTLTNA